LRPHRKIYPFRPTKTSQARESYCPKPALADVPEIYIADMDRFFFKLSLIDVYDRSVIDYLGLSNKDKDACAVLINSLNQITGKKLVALSSRSSKTLDIGKVSIFACVQQWGTKR